MPSRVNGRLQGFNGELRPRGINDGANHGEQVKKHTKWPKQQKKNSINEDAEQKPEASAKTSLAHLA